MENIGLRSADRCRSLLISLAGAHQHQRALGKGRIDKKRAAIRRWPRPSEYAKRPNSTGRTRCRKHLCPAGQIQPASAEGVATCDGADGARDLPGERDDASHFAGVNKSGGIAGS